MNRTKLDQETIEEIAELHNFSIGLTVLGKCYNVSHGTIRTALMRENIYQVTRQLDQKLERKRLGINEHIPKHKITHVIDFTGAVTDGSIRKRHHARTVLRSILVGTILNVRTKRIIFHVWKSGKEDTSKVMYLVQKAPDQGERIKFLRSDRVLRKVARGCSNLLQNYLITQD